MSYPQTYPRLISACLVQACVTSACVLAYTVYAVLVRTITTLLTFILQGRQQRRAHDNLIINIAVVQHVTDLLDCCYTIIEASMVRSLLHWPNTFACH